MAQLARPLLHPERPAPEKLAGLNKETGQKKGCAMIGAERPEHGPGGLAAWFAGLLATASPAPVMADRKTIALFDLARQVAPGRATVLVTGPSGAGKEVVARFLHDESPRRRQPFLALNCAALPETMLEAMLFGHERGAFTGAQGASAGLFRAASGGTLFLDELGELPLSLQAKLLRAVELGEVLPLGATAPVTVDVRLVAATNRNLAAEVAAGRFRADLYWRLAVFPLAIPPLAERPADILPLAAMLLRRNGVVAAPTMGALQALLSHDWPGNVRELSNVLERAAILAGGQPIATHHIGIEVRQPAASSLADDLRQHETQALQTALAETDGRRSEAAARLGISERALRYKLAALAGRPRNPARAGASARLVLA